MILRRLVQAIGLLIAGVVVAALIMLQVLNKESLWVPSIRTVSVALFTGALFVSLIRQFRTSWSSIRFWVSLAVLLVIHIAAYLAAFSVVEDWRLAWLFLAGAGEFFLFGLVLESLGYSDRQRRGRRRMDRS